ncbi:MAG TPA: hypothetical protein VGX91_00945 [Candidatus Cybelea sp.]|nr:hypothetical protein [Candidatus Cybelea sp.]
MKNLRNSAATGVAFFLIACGGSNVAPSAPTMSVAPAAYKGLDALYVVDEKQAEVQVLKNGTYALEATITKGLAYPTGDWLDADGNLYVADTHNHAIIEYKPGGSSPSFSYYAVEPYGAIATDLKGNVYAGDAAGGQGYGGVLEYRQGVKNAVSNCNTHGNPDGVAVDSNGDVFAAVDGQDFESIFEFKGGLKRCKYTTLVSIGLLGGMAIDKNKNLVVTEPQEKAVAILAPPYSKVTGTLGSGYSVPESVTLSSDNKLAFVTDVGKNEVFVVDYPSGKLVKAIGKANGLKTPVRAVDGPNAVY